LVLRLWATKLMLCSILPLSFDAHRSKQAVLSNVLTAKLPVAFTDKHCYMEWVGLCSNL